MIDPAPAASSWRGVLAGAIIGGVFGYICFTADGRRLHQRFDSWLDDAIEEIRRLEQTQAKIRAAIGEGKRLIETR